jgi:hypothetical protein
MNKKNQEGKGQENRKMGINVSQINPSNKIFESYLCLETSNREELKRQDVFCNQSVIIMGSHFMLLIMIMKTISSMIFLSRIHSFTTRLDYCDFIKVVVTGFSVIIIIITIIFFVYLKQPNMRSRDAIESIMLPFEDAFDLFHYTCYRTVWPMKSHSVPPEVPKVITWGGPTMHKAEACAQCAP